MYKAEDLTSKRYGNLIVIRRLENRGKKPVWHCLCDCGNTFDTLAQNLRLSKSTSCGCLTSSKKSKASTTHGYSKSATYKSWQKMKDRCMNKNNPRYHQYGGAGIILCEDWLVFEKFLEDMGERRKGTSIDRIDNKKGYYKENCKWSTPKEQMNNISLNRLVEYKDKIQSLALWCDELELDYSVIYSRLRRKWTTIRAFETPVISKKASQGCS